MADVHIELDDDLIRSLKATADLKGRTLGRAADISVGRRP